MFRLEVDKLHRASQICPSCTEEAEKRERCQQETGISGFYCITSKIEELKHFLKKHKIDVFLFKNTKLYKNDSTPEFPGYAIERRDRPQPASKQKDRGGGLLLGVRSTIPCKYMDKLNIKGTPERPHQRIPVDRDPNDQQEEDKDHQHLCPPPPIQLCCQQECKRK